MTEYFYSADVVRVVLVTGVIVSMLFYERLQLTTGGAIVPAYLALGLYEPFAVITTILAGFATYWVVANVIAKRKILYGRKKFEIELLVGLAFVAIIATVRMIMGEFTPEAALITSIGFLVPGILAHDMSRQKPLITVYAVLGSTAIIGLFLVIYLNILPMFGAPVESVDTLATQTGYDQRLMFVAVVLSVLVGMFLFSKLELRTGGFISSAYLALILPRWEDLVFVGVVAVLTYLVVVKLLMPNLLIFGRRKLSTMVLFAALIGWAIELGLRFISDDLYAPGRGLIVMTLMIPALIANDAQRQGWEKTVWGLGISTAAVYGFTNLIAAGLLAIGILS